MDIVPQRRRGRISIFVAILTLGILSFFKLSLGNRGEVLFEMEVIASSNLGTEGLILLRVD